MSTLLRRNWNSQVGAVGRTHLRFVIQKDGRIADITIEQSSGWRLPRRVPIVKIDTSPHSTSLPDGHTDQMRLYVDYLWYRDEIEKEAQSWLSRTGFGMEIEIRGDLILDCQHQQLDANAHGLDPMPSGNGSPGGTFISTFWVKPKPDGNREPAASW